MQIVVCPQELILLHSWRNGSAKHVSRAISYLCAALPIATMTCDTRPVVNYLNMGNVYIENKRRPGQLFAGLFQKETEQFIQEIKKLVKKP